MHTCSQRAECLLCTLEPLDAENPAAMQADIVHRSSVEQSPPVLKR